MIRVLTNVAAPGGVAEIELGPVARGATVSASVHVRSSSTGGLFLLRRAAIARLRPDLVVAAVHAPPQTLTTRAIDVVADVSELNGDVGATATLRLMLGPTPLAEPKTVTVPKGGSVSVQFPGVNLTTAMSAELSVLIDDAAPFETDGTNNSRSSTVEVTEHELVRSNVLVQALGGYGAQFNNHVYAPITSVARRRYGDFEDKAKALQPHIVRIFYNDNFEERQSNWFGTCNRSRTPSSWRTRRRRPRTTSPTRLSMSRSRSPSGLMGRFAAVLESGWSRSPAARASAGCARARRTSSTEDQRHDGRTPALHRPLDAELAAGASTGRSSSWAVLCDVWPDRADLVPVHRG